MDPGLASVSAEQPGPPLEGGRRGGERGEVVIRAPREDPRLWLVRTGNVSEARGGERRGEEREEEEGMEARAGKRGEEKEEEGTVMGPDFNPRCYVYTHILLY